MLCNNYTIVAKHLQSHSKYLDYTLMSYTVDTTVVKNSSPFLVSVYGTWPQWPFGCFLRNGTDFIPFWAIFMKWNKFFPLFGCFYEMEQIFSPFWLFSKKNFSPFLCFFNSTWHLILIDHPLIVPDTERLEKTANLFFID